MQPSLIVESSWLVGKLGEQRVVAVVFRQTNNVFCELSVSNGDLVNSWEDDQVVESKVKVGFHVALEGESCLVDSGSVGHYNIDDWCDVIVLTTKSNSSFGVKSEWLGYSTIY